MASQLSGAQRRSLRARYALGQRSDRPRLSVFRSHAHMYAQVIHDGRTLASASTLEQDVKSLIARTDNVDAARVVGEIVARKAMAQNITQVVFDRGGCKYHGRVQALAEAARKEGLTF